MGGCEFLNSVANSRKFGIVNWSGASRLTQGRIPQMINHPNRSKSVGMEIAITSEIAAKVLATVDAGLCSGVGVPELGKMCVEAAVCYALGLPHGDKPSCVSRALRSFKVNLNDVKWSSNTARAKGLRRLALVQLGSAGHLDDRKFAKRVAKLAIQKAVPAALRAAASIHKDAKHREALLEHASICEREGTRQAALDAKKAAYAADAASDAAYAAAACYAATAAAAAAAAAAACYAADYAAYAAAAAAAAAAACYAATAAATAAAAAAARDKSLA